MNGNAAQQLDGDLQPGEGASQYLTFRLGEEDYGVDILKVQEIKGWTEVTPMPNTPDAILGVINLRGTVVPVVDLRRHFGLPEVPRGPTTVIIVVRADDGKGNVRTMGVVVDSVSEVYNIPASEVQPPPPAADGVRNAIAGLVTVDEEMIILLDIDDLMVNGVLGRPDRDAGEEPEQRAHNGESHEDQ
jgi:Chemotaxis signal transduction protein